jgi:hypothetical protein
MKTKQKAKMIIYPTADCGAVPNETAAMGNPLRGLAGGSRWAAVPLPEPIPFTIEWCNVGVRVCVASCKSMVDYCFPAES